MDCPDLYPLHSAIRSCDLEAAELLLKEGINIHSKDVNGRIPLELLVYERIKILSSVNDNGRSQSVEAKIEKNEKLIDMLLKHSSTDQQYSDDMQLLNFYASCMLTNCSIIDRLLEKVADINQSISKHSSFFPGYTALHFAAYSNAETVKVLITRGGDLLARDSKGVTPLDICLRFHNLEDVFSILACVTAWKNILFSNGETKLMDFLDCLKDDYRLSILLENTKEAVTMSLPKDAPVWPGYTILHLAVTLLPESEIYKIERIARHGADVTAPSRDGSTPIHLVYRHAKWSQHRKSDLICKFFRYPKKVVNSLDKDSLSLLHIACALNKTYFVKKLLALEASVDVAYEGTESLPAVKPGWTPLFTASFTEHSNLTAMLLQSGADPLRTDAKGFTALHRLFEAEGNKQLVIDALSASEKFKDCTVEGMGLSHLHVMISWKQSVESIEKLLDKGADIEATILKINDKSLKKFQGCRPLHLALMNGSRDEIVGLLLKRGADIFIKKPDGTSPLSQVLSGKYKNPLLGQFTSLLWINVNLQNRMKEELGLTMLHVVCYALDSEKVETLLEEGVDVNARTFDSCFWPGFTPLHVLMSLRVKHDCCKDAKEIAQKLVDLLLTKEADVGLINAKGETPIHFVVESRNNNERKTLANHLLQYYKSFDVNLTNNEGLSLFHLACLGRNSTAVRKFLQCGVDVKQSVKMSARRFAGESPLHLILNPGGKPVGGAKLLIQMVDLLLEHGANVHAVDALGQMPLHVLAQYTSIQGRTRKELLNKIVKTDKDMKRETIEGNTPFEELLHHGTSPEDIEYFINKGSKVNGYNRISGQGYMGIILSHQRHKTRRKSILDLMMNSPGIVEISVGGRNAIHNAIGNSCNQMTRNEFEDLVEKLIQLGCDLHQQDCSGKTPLHLAVQLRDVTAVFALLACGADINVVDYAGQSPCSAAVQTLFGGHYYNHEITKHLVLHLKQLQYVGLEVSQDNLSHLNDERLKSKFGEMVLDLGFMEQVDETREVKIGSRGLTLRDFVFQNDIAKIISRFTNVERDEVGTFFDSTIDDEDNYRNKFDSLRGLLKLQYRKVLERLPLIIPAVRSFNILLGFPMPDLCIEVILKFLNNVELKSLISAADDVGDESMEIIID